MKNSIVLAAVVSAFALGSIATTASAQDRAACEAQAVTKTTSQPLVGKAKIASVSRCMREVCEPKAVDKKGKKLAGQAKNSFMRKCEKTG